MEQKIYPLNIGQGDEKRLLTPRPPKKKKPHFKDWIKERKWMVLGVVGICLATIGTIIYTSGLGDKLLGAMVIDPATSNTIQLDKTIIALPGDTISGKLDFSSYAGGDVISYTLKVDNLSQTIKWGTTISQGNEVVNFTWDGKVGDNFIKPGEHTLKLDVKKQGPGGATDFAYDNFKKKFLVVSAENQPQKPTLEKFYYVENPAATDKPSDTPGKFNLYGDKKVNVYFKIKDYPENGKTWITVKDDADKLAIISSIMDDEEVWTWKDINYKVVEDGGDYTLNISIAGIDPEIKFDKSLTLHVGEPAKTLKPENCDNDIDDDEDGLIDSEDTAECKAEEEVTPPQCKDGLDNDTDGHTDFPNDTDCESQDDETEDGKEENPSECNDGLDNDEDGDIDYPNDDGCKTIGDVSEDTDFNIPEGTEIKISNVSVSKNNFNPEIHEIQFVYTISDDANVKIEVLDKDGKVIATVKKEQEEEKGQHVAWWNGTVDNKFGGQEIADGTYVFKITATHPEYEEVKDTKEGSITADSTAGNGEGDFEDPGGGGAKPSEGAGKGTGEGLLGKTPDELKADEAKKTLQNSGTGQTAGTGPEILLYLLIPALALPLTKKS